MMPTAYHPLYHDFLTPPEWDQWEEFRQPFWARFAHRGGTPPPPVFEEAALWLDSQYSVAGEPRVINRGTGDTTGKSGAVIYDGALRGGTSVGNRLRITNTDESLNTPEFDYAIHVSGVDWDRGANNDLCGVNQRFYLYEVAGVLVGRVSTDGVTYSASNDFISAAHGLVDNEPVWLRITFAPDNGAGGRTWRAYKNTSDGPGTYPTSWTEIGSGSTSAGIITPFAATNDFMVGYAVASGNGLPGATINRLVSKSTIGGTTVLDVDLSTAPNWARSFTATTGQTVTLDTTAAKFGAPSALDAKYGSVLGAYVYDGAAVLPGVTGNRLTVPDEAAFGVTGDIELVARVSLDDWTPAATATIINKFGSAGASNRSYGLVVQTTGVPQFWYAVGATTYYHSPASGTPTWVDGQTYWLRVTRTSADGVINFYYAEDSPTEPSSWTTIGASASAIPGALNVSTDPVYLGGTYGTTNMLDGSVYRTIIRDGIDGTTVLDVNLADVDDYATSFTATTGQTVTVNSTSSDTNDPLLLTHTGDNYVYLPGSGTNMLRCDYGSVLSSLTSTLEFSARARVEDFSVNFQFAGWNSTHAGMYIDAGTKALRLRVLNTSVASIGGATGPALPVGTGVDFWVRGSLDISTAVATFWYSLDDTNDVDAVNWTLLGSSAAGSNPGTTPLLTSSNLLLFGAWSTGGSTLNGRLYAGQHKADGVDRVTWRIDNAGVTQTSIPIVSGTDVSSDHLVYLRATSGRKTTLVTRPVWLFGTDDYMEVADNALLDFGASDSFTIMAVYRDWGTRVQTWIVGKSNDNALTATMTGYAVNDNGTVAQSNRYGDGTTRQAVNDNSALPTVGTLMARGLVRDTDADEHFSWMNNTGYAPATDTTTGSMATSTPLIIGKTGTATIYKDMELLSVAVWRRALTADELTDINEWYGTV